MKYIIILLSLVFCYYSYSDDGTGPEDFESCRIAYKEVIGEREDLKKINEDLTRQNTAINATVQNFRNEIDALKKVEAGLQQINASLTAEKRSMYALLPKLKKENNKLKKKLKANNLKCSERGLASFQEDFDDRPYDLIKRAEDESTAGGGTGGGTSGSTGGDDDGGSSTGGSQGVH